MPGFITHYLWGVDSYKDIPDKTLKKVISENRYSYGLGLLGPDLFFYFMPTTLNIKPNMGNIMHKKKTGEFFRRLINSVAVIDNDTDFNTALAYIEGFMGHYILDTAVHPYVYSRIGIKADNSTLGTHFGLETDIDRKVFFRQKGKRLSEFRNTTVVNLSQHERNIIAQLLSRAILATYETSISTTLIKAAMVSFSLESRLLSDKTNRKYKFMNTVEKATMRYDFISPLFANDITHTDDPCNELHAEWCNPWAPDNKSTESVWEIMKKAKDAYTRNMLYMHTALDNSYRSADDPSPKILELLGNNSYSSGLDCSIELKR